MVSIFHFIIVENFENILHLFHLFYSQFFKLDQTNINKFHENHYAIKFVNNTVSEVTQNKTYKYDAACYDLVHL